MVSLNSGGNLGAPERVVYAQSEGSLTSEIWARSATRPDRPELFDRSVDRSSIPAEGRCGRLELAAAGRLRGRAARCVAVPGAARPPLPSHAGGIGPGRSPSPTQGSPT